MHPEINRSVCFNLMTNILWTRCLQHWKPEELQVLYSIWRGKMHQHQLHRKGENTMDNLSLDIYLPISWSCQECAATDRFESDDRIRSFRHGVFFSSAILLHHQRQIKHTIDGQEKKMLSWTKKRKKKEQNFICLIAASKNQQKIMRNWRERELTRCLIGLDDDDDHQRRTRTREEEEENVLA